MSSLRPPLRRLLTFGLVGGTGFVVDAGVLAFGIHLVGLSPAVARVPSFLCALIVTYLGNRFFTFGQRKQPAPHRPLRYVAASGVTSLLNLGIYLAAIAILPKVTLAPFMALVIATGVSMFSNFFLYSTFVFGRRGTATQAAGID